MNFSISKFLNKLQNLPEKQKKIILFTIVIILGLIMGFFWINASIKRLESVDLSGIKLPEIQMPEAPDILQTTTPSNADIFSEKTADWKTYANSDYGFEIKMPADWKIVDSSCTEICNFDFENPAQNDSFYVTVSKTTEISLSKLAESFYKKDLVKSIDYIEINGNQAAYIQMLASANIGDDLIMINNGFVYEIPPVASYTSDVVKTIISTFKFTK